MALLFLSLYSVAAIMAVTDFFEKLEEDGTDEATDANGSAGTTPTEAGPEEDLLVITEGGIYVTDEAANTVTSDGPVADPVDVSTLAGNDTIDLVVNASTEAKIGLTGVTGLDLADISLLTPA